MSPLHRWRTANPTTKKRITQLLKFMLTVGVFYVLLSAQIKTPTGEHITIAQALHNYLGEIELRTVLPFLVLATLIKFVGIGCSMFRWHLLLQGQGIRFNFGHIVGSFLIGRFLGTFLPSTVGLDGYKLYDAAKFSGKTVEPAAATALEKVMGLSGIFLSFLVCLPWGYKVLFLSMGDAASSVVIAGTLISLGVVGGLFTVLFWPKAIEFCLRMLPSFGRKRVERITTRVIGAATAYRGKAGLLFGVMGLSFMVHFTTAAMYYFTALAVGATVADFWQVSLASVLQILATVLSPFTIGGEGIREAAQAFLLAEHMGVTQAILSAALGFWAAEALTLGGVFFLWHRKSDYKPKRMQVETRSETGGNTSTASAVMRASAV